MPKAASHSQARKLVTLRGPAHGLQGSAPSQRSSGRATGTLQHSQLRQLQRQGDAAQVAERLASDSNVDLLEDHYLPGADLPVNEHVLPDDGSEWEDDDRGGEDGGERSGDDLSNERQSMRKEMKRVYRDFRTRRDRTDRTWVNFEAQMDEMVTSYMDWSYSEAHGLKTQREPKELLNIQVWDVFGKFLRPHCNILTNHPTRL